jgi:hypothetical protein
MGNTEKDGVLAVIETAIKCASAFRRKASGNESESSLRQQLIARIERMPYTVSAAIERRANALIEVLAMEPAALDGWREVLAEVEVIATDPLAEDFEDVSQAVEDLMWYKHKLYYYFNSDYREALTELAYDRLWEVRSNRKKVTADQG